MRFIRRRFLAFFFLLFACPGSAFGGKQNVIAPSWPVPDYVEYLLQVAAEEIGYKEDHGRSKYGAWAGDPAAQWCAEFQCWCVDQVDQRYGTSLLRNVYPFYTSSNTGRDWFIRAGRYVVRKGKVEGWGYEWLKGRSSYIRSGDYIPQPGDWIFFNWGGGSDTEHVALVEFCTRDVVSDSIQVHVIEGNNPDAVDRNTYDLNSNSILGYGTVRDVADFTMSFGNRGEKVRMLQEKLVYLGFLNADSVSGHFGNVTLEAVRAYQESRGLKVNGIADMNTQLLLDDEYTQLYESDPEIWSVIDDD